MKIQKRIRLFSASRVSYWPRVAFVALMFLSLGMLSIQMGAPGAYAGFRVMFMDTINPVFAAMSGVSQTIAETVSNVTDISTLRSRNEQLVAENTKLKLTEQEAQKLADENMHLRKSLHVTPDLPAKFTTARIISDTSSGLVRSFVINGGRNQNIKKGHAVLAEGNFIGRVQDVSDDASRVVLITDYASRIPSVAGLSSEQGVLTGDNSDVLRFVYAAQPQSINPGDAVLTSGKGGGVPPGLPIGKIDRWDGVQFRVVPNVDLAALRYVQVADYGLIQLLDEFPQNKK